MSYVLQHKEWKPVTNLGWLLRNWKQIEKFYVYDIRTKYLPDFDLPPTTERHWDCWLVAALADGRVFATQWADKSVLKDWLVRPRFSGLSVRWFGVDVEIPYRRKDW